MRDSSRVKTDEMNVVAVNKIYPGLFSYKLYNKRDETRTINTFTRVLSRVLQNIYETDVERISGRNCLHTRLISSRRRMAMVWTRMTSYSNRTCLCLEMKVWLMFPRLN